MRRYDAALLGELVGPEFALVETIEHVYHQPSGNPRPYVYALFRRAVGEAEAGVTLAGTVVLGALEGAVLTREAGKAQAEGPATNPYTQTNNVSKPPPFPKGHCDQDNF